MRNKTLMQTVLAASLLVLGSAGQAAQYVVGSGDLDRDGIENRHDRDRDGDGIPNARDPRPNVPDRFARGSRHGNQYGMDVTPRDRDGDGVPNRRDRFPDNPRRA